MRLYSLMGTVALDDPEHGTFNADETGAFDFPEEVADRLHAFHFRGKPMWETEIERQQRLIGEELERRKDPATLLSAVEQLVKAASAAGSTEFTLAPPPVEPVPAAVTEPTTPAPAPAKKAPSKRAASKTAQ